MFSLCFCVSMFLLRTSRGPQGRERLRVTVEAAAWEAATLNEHGSVGGDWARCTGSPQAIAPPLWLALWLALLGSGGATLQNVLRHPFMKAESHPHFFAQTPISGGSQKVNLLHFAYLEAAQIQPGSSKSTSQGGLTSQ